MGRGTCLLTAWGHGLRVNGGCQRCQLTPPPHLELLTAGRSINDHRLSGTPCTPSKECWMDICKKSDLITPATIAQDGILVRTLTSDFWVDWALLPLSTRSSRLQGTQSSQGKISLQNALVWRLLQFLQLLTAWRHGLRVNGGCQRCQLTPPPHLALLTAGCCN